MYLLWWSIYLAFSSGSLFSYQCVLRVLLYKLQVLSQQCDLQICFPSLYLVYLFFYGLFLRKKKLQFDKEQLIYFLIMIFACGIMFQNSVAQGQKLFSYYLNGQLNLFISIKHFLFN